MTSVDKAGTAEKKDLPKKDLSRKKDPPRATVHSRLMESGRIVLGAVVITLVLRVSIVEAYRISTGSMENTIIPVETLLGNKFIYGARLPLIGVRLPAIRAPRPGDLIVFKHPVEEGIRLVKRVIAVEGQTIEIRNKQVYVDGGAVPLPETAKFIDPRLLPQSQSTRDNVITVTVPEDRLFVMGDNRDNSIDSRSWGFLDEDLILAKAVLVLYSWEPDPTRPFWNRIRWGRFGHILR